MIQSPCSNRGIAPALLDGLILTCMTDDPAVATLAAAAGVERIGPDLEKLGKADRQHNIGTRLSVHSPDCLPALFGVIGASNLFARINPIHPNSEDEIETVLGRGVCAIMLPYFHTVGEVREFSRLVRGRARTIVLVETAAAAFFIERIADVDGIDEVHIGLTDMMLSAKTGSRFAILTSELMEGIVRAVRSRGKPLHLAGVARVDDTSMPIPSDLTLARFAQLGVNGALLTRAFMSSLETKAQFIEAVQALRQRYAYWQTCDPALRDDAALRMKSLVDLRMETGSFIP